ncbi:perilipin-3 [Trichonephila inaurata madagascariensis]|uniref:Perilipin-3 n=1 Tax=Trichonephila inaurata madagascariensis TaxID=2747483 RepID=A0A8X7BTX8_9ARAC|nr:perilipin-3 [Trichonephila inaurata madagascariensis]
MVHVAWDYATNTYSHIKESNRLVNFTLTNAEKTATFVAGQAKPVVLKFEKQIQAVDDLACKGLGTLEEKVPFIKKPADEIIGDTRKLYATTVNSRLDTIKKYGNDTVRSAADFGIRHATAIFGENIVKSVLTSVDGVLIVTQNYVDYILPPTKEEKQSNGTKEETEKPSKFVRLVKLSNAIRRRGHRAILLQMEYLQEKSLDLFLVYPLQLIEITKVNLDSAVEYANKLWVAIWKQEVDETDATEKNRIEQQLLHLARLVSKQVAATYTSFSLTSSESDANNSQEVPQAPVVVTAARDGAMWVMGMLKLIPQLLPMYMYGLVLWLEKKRKPMKKPDSEKEANENGSVHKDNTNRDHSHENNTHVSHDDSGIDKSISEENRD